jgi:hypothetical protein
VSAGSVGDVVCGDVGGGERQPASCGICLFLTNTAARLLVRVTSMYVSIAVVLVMVTGPAVAGQASAKVSFAPTGSSGETWPAAATEQAVVMRPDHPR